MFSLKNFVPRAYIATYQDLGFIKDNYLTVISPTKNIKQYQLVQNLIPIPQLSLTSITLKIFYKTILEKIW